MKVLDQKTKSSIAIKVAIGTEAAFATAVSFFTVLGELAMDAYDSITLFDRWKAEAAWKQENGAIPNKHALAYRRGKCYLTRIV